MESKRALAFCFASCFFQKVPKNVSGTFWHDALGKFCAAQFAGADPEIGSGAV
jgi:hypothetical protein